MVNFLRENAPFLSAGALLMFLSSFGQTFFISIFAGEIREEFGLSHGDWGTLYGVATTASAIVMIWAGALTDRFRVRTLAAVVLPLLALACAMMAGSWAAWMLIPTVFLLRFAGQGMATQIATVAMARWFVRTRGRALSIAGLGFAVGEAFLPMIVVSALAVVQWRLIWVVAAIFLVAMVPVVYALLAQERTPQADIAANPSPGLRGHHWSRRDVLGHWLFWALVPTLLGPPAFGTALFFHQVHLADIKEISHLGIVSLFPVYTITATIAMFASGFVIDRFGSGRLLPIYLIPVAMGFVLIGLAGGLPGIALGFILFGISTGGHSTLPAAFLAEFYGTQHLGGIKAMASAIMVLGSAIGPALTGALIDLGVSFETQLIWIGGYYLACCLILSIAIPRASRALAPTG